MSRPEKVTICILETKFKLQNFPHENMDRNIYSSTIHNSQKVETARYSTN